MSRPKEMKREDLKSKAPMSLQDMIAAIKRADTQPAASDNGFEADADFVTNSLRAEFVAQVRAVMKQRGIKNPAQLAKRSGLSRERISKILMEKGNIELRTIARIATALEAPVVVRIGRKNVEAGASPQPRPVKSLVVHVTSSEYFPECGSASTKDDFRAGSSYAASYTYSALASGEHGS